MSAYITITELEELGVNAKALTALTTQQKNTAIEAASGMADSYMRNRYPVPLTAAVADIDMGLKIAVAGIAAYLGLKARGFAPSSPDDLIVKGYDDGMKHLAKLASGMASLDISTDPPSPEVDATPMVDSDDLRGFGTDWV